MDNQKIAYHTPTRELFEKKIQEWLDQGCRWESGRTGVPLDVWEDEKENTCVSLKNGYIVYGSFNTLKILRYTIMPAEKTLETLEVGDLIQTTKGQYKEVLFAQGYGPLRVYILSWLSQYQNGEDLKRADSIYTATDLKENGYRVFPPQAEIPEYTMDEAIEKLGHTFKIKK